MWLAEALLDHKDVGRIPLMVMANKQDLKVRCARRGLVAGFLTASTHLAFTCAGCRVW